MNDKFCMELSFEMINAKRVSKSLEVSHESVFIELLNKTSELGDIRTGSGSYTDKMARNIAAVKNVEAFVPVSKNPPDELEYLNSALVSCALEADRATVNAVPQ